MSLKQKEPQKYVFRRLKMLFAGCELSQKQPSNSVQEYIIKNLYRTYKYVDSLKKLLKEFRELATDKQIKKRIANYKAQIEKSDGKKKMKDISKADYDNLLSQIENIDAYEVEIREAIVKSLRWVQPYLDIVNNLEYKHFEKINQIKFAMQNMAHADFFVKGLQEDLQETRDLVDQIYEKYIEDVEMLELFVDDSKNLFKNLLGQIISIKPDEGS